MTRVGLVAKARFLWLATILGGLAGCGSYEARLERELKRREEVAELNSYLNGPIEGKYKDELVYVRPPKPLPGQPTDFRLVPGLTDAQYDLRSSFTSLRQDGNVDLDLHVLARHKKPPRAAAKGAPPEPDQSQRGDFTSDVLTLLNTVHNNAASGATANKVRVKGGNEFNRYIYEVGNGYKIQVYLLTGKKVGQDTFDVALIWGLSPDQQKNTKPIELCLQTLAVGPAATRAFSGQADDTGLDAQEQQPTAL